MAPFGWGLPFPVFLALPPPTSGVPGGWRGVCIVSLGGLYLPRGYKAEKIFHLLFRAFVLCCWGVLVLSVAGCSCLGVWVGF